MPYIVAIPSVGLLQDGPFFKGECPAQPTGGTFIAFEARNAVTKLDGRIDASIVVGNADAVARLYRADVVRIRTDFTPGDIIRISRQYEAMSDPAEAS